MSLQEAQGRSPIKSAEDTAATKKSVVLQYFAHELSNVERKLSHRHSHRKAADDAEEGRDESSAADGANEEGRDVFRHDRLPSVAYRRSNFSREQSATECTRRSSLPRPGKVMESGAHCERSRSHSSATSSSNSIARRSSLTCISGCSTRAASASRLGSNTSSTFSFSQGKAGKTNQVVEYFFYIEFSELHLKDSAAQHPPQVLSPRSKHRQASRQAVDDLTRVKSWNSDTAAESQPAADGPSQDSTAGKASGEEAMQSQLPFDGIRRARSLKRAGSARRTGSPEDVRFLLFTDAAYLCDSKSKP